MEDEAIRVTRMAESTMHPDENVVDVRYEIAIEDRASGKVERVLENHRMRYFFKPELSRSLKWVGLEPIKFGEWPTSQPAGVGSWSAYVVASTIDGFRHA
jgi:hypothetical protein